MTWAPLSILRRDIDPLLQTHQARHSGPAPLVGYHRPKAHPGMTNVRSAIERMRDRNERDTISHNTARQLILWHLLSGGAESRIRRQRPHQIVSDPPVPRI